MCDFIPVFILFGTRRSIKPLWAETFPCPRCHNAAVTSIKKRTWLTLYYIPVLPISSKKQLYHCSICSWEGVPVSVTTHSEDSGADYSYGSRRSSSRQHHAEHSSGRGAKAGSRKPKADRASKTPRSNRRPSRASAAASSGNGGANCGSPSRATPEIAAPIAQPAADYEEPPPPYTQA